MTDVHPDDDALSATLDGEEDPAATAHVQGCGACRARLDALDAVRRLVAADPGPAPAGLADRVVPVATRAWRDERARDTVVPLRPPARAASGRRLPPWALGAVAAAAALLLAVPFLLRDSERSETTASAPTGTAAEAGAALDDDGVDGGHLGSLSDPGTLRQELERAVAGVAGRTGAAAEAAPMAAPSADDAGEDAAAGPPSPAAAPAPRAADEEDAQYTAGSRPLSAGAARSCGAEVRSSYGTGLGDLVYTASLRWQDTDAVLLAYRLADTSGPGPDHRAFVMAIDGCRLLVVQGF